MTALFYRQHQSREEGAVAHAIRTSTQRDRTQTDSSEPVWWSSLFGSGNDQQEVVDDYLEFLDKRYHRLHDEEEKKENQFSAFSWLKQKQSLSQDPKQDALYILGVADMASQKLLQKHKKPKSIKAQNAQSTKLAEDVEKRLSSPSTVARAAAAPPALLLKSHRAISKAATMLVAFVNMLRKRREKFIEPRVGQLRAIVRKYVASVPKAAQVVWKMAGGEESLALTLALVAYLSTLLRPVF